MYIHPYIHTHRQINLFILPGILGYYIHKLIQLAIINVQKPIYLTAIFFKADTNSIS